MDEETKMLWEEGNYSCSLTSAESKSVKYHRSPSSGLSFLLPYHTGFREPQDSRESLALHRAIKEMQQHEGPGPVNIKQVNNKFCSHLECKHWRGYFSFSLEAPTKFSTLLEFGNVNSVCQGQHIYGNNMYIM